MSKAMRHEIRNIRRLRSRLGECTVLLKKDGSFPLEKAGTIAAYGSGVRHTVKGGTGSGEVNSRYFITVEKGLRKSGFTIVNDSWLDQYDLIREENTAAFYKEIKAKAKREKTNVIAASMGAIILEPEYDLPLDFSADAAIYVVGRSSGEGNDRLDIRGDYRLTETEVRDILALNSRYEHFMLVINAGGPVDLSEVMEVRNILVLSQLGVETGRALASLLIGKLYPSGKLTTTWAPYKDYGIKSFAQKDDTLYSEGIFVGYRYFDRAGVKPAFPFGYGLSYTDFTHEFVEIAADGPVVTVTARVRNVGRWRGKEVLQVYLSSPEGKLVKEPRSLAGFAKTGPLIHGESELVTISWDMRGRSSFDEERAAYVLEAGRYYVQLGSSSADAAVVAALDLDEEFIVRRVKHCLVAITTPEVANAATIATPEVANAATIATPEVANAANSAITTPEVANAATIATPEVANAANSAIATPEVANAATDTPEVANAPATGTSEVALPPLPQIRLNLSACETEVIDYTLPTFDDPLLDRLTDEELAYLNMGGFDPKGGILSVIGNASSRVAGAAGETTSALEVKGIGCAVVADGPAGLRLARHYYEDKKGIHAIGSTMPETMLELLPKPLLALINLTSRPPRGAKIFEQYTTALPIGTAIAQSWNIDFAHRCGDIVGNEMEIFNVDLWLAPALNIHRSVLCGRNFEYFSEDPLVSGKFAAALTLGVQSHRGKGVTIKHYAANNQETNRYGNSSNVSERALREIYLRGFEICIKEGRPLAVMSSYNLINGVHTSESEELCKDLLRSEFGFDGVLMTDWIVGGDLLSGGGKYPSPSAPHVAASGHTLFMPGGKKDYEDLVQGTRDGIVSREQLKWNAHWLLEMLRITQR